MDDREQTEYKPGSDPWDNFRKADGYLSTYMDDLSESVGRMAVLTTRDMLQHVMALDASDRQRAIYLNKIARGEATMDARQRDLIAGMERQMSAILGVVSPHTRRVIDADTASGKGTGGSGSAGLGQVGMGSGAIGEMPARVRDLYALLCLAVYGMGDRKDGGGVSAGDLGKASGAGRVWRDDSGQKTTMNAAKPGKGNSGGKKSKVLVVNDRAFRFKRKMDLRLRRMAADMELFLAGESGEGKGVRGQKERRRVCTSCNKIAEYDWRHCPRCGATTKEMDE